MRKSNRNHAPNHFSDLSDNFGVSDHSKGFTLIELLVVISLVTIMAGVAMAAFGNLQTSTQLNETSTQIVQTLRMAREQSIAGLNNAAHGIKFNPTAYVLYQGDSYATRDLAYDRVYKLDSALTITTTLTNNEIFFSKGVGVPSAGGLITISHSVNGFKRISINTQGIIEEK
ncbi:MAG: prepilin-type N-terminal cleavage/methylation domain-containing protein [Candidatus Uhrbacteria bacterium]